MRCSVRAIATLSIFALLAPEVSAVTQKTKKKTPTTRSTKKHAISRKTVKRRSTAHARVVAHRKPAVAPVSPVVRASSLATLQNVMQRGAGPSTVENEAALVPFFDQLYRARSEQKPVHILQFGDSHTASDDWANAMRNMMQARFGDGGAGFTDPGHPYRGYRNFRVSSGNSAAWRTEGIVSNQGDRREGLGGISLSTSRAGESVWMQSDGEEVELFFQQQPGGGQLNFLVDGKPQTTISTDGPLGPGYFSYPSDHAMHTFEVQTITQDPVRLFGWVSQNRTGITYETLGINGAQADLVASWDESTFEPQVSRRDPALIVFAYGTNEALSPRFTVAGYRTAFSEALLRLRRGSPTASILVVGPPDCWLKRRGQLIAFPHIDEVIEIQREVAAAQRCAFWDWRRRMGGEGSKRRWVTAGLAQVDYVHFTSTGYQLIGNTLCADLLDLYNVFVSVRNQAENDGSTDNRERPQGSNKE